MVRSKVSWVFFFFSLYGRDETSSEFKSTVERIRSFFIKHSTSYLNHASKCRASGQTYAGKVVEIVELS